MVFLKNALMCIKKKVKLINHDCLPILMLLYIMLYIMLAYLMLFAALSNVVCLYNASVFCHLFLQMLFVFMLCLGLLTHSLFISCVNLVLLTWYVSLLLLVEVHVIQQFTVQCHCAVSLVTQLNKPKMFFDVSK